MTAARVPSNKDFAGRRGVPVLERGIGDILSLGFAATVAMWTVGYFCRMPATAVPGPLTVALMALCLLGAGVLAGRFAAGAGRSVLRGFWVGCTASILNLLVLGSLLTEKQPQAILRTAAIWIPCFLLAGGFLAFAGALVGKAFPIRRVNPVNWTFVFACVTVAATLLLIIAGGMVTGMKAGLAVPDWPTSFQSNMFLFPISRMTGGIYFEHTHRLIGSLVGFAVLVQAIRLLKVDWRVWVKILAFAAGLLVLIQAILGGERVTQPSVPLAISHGILAQVVLATLCVIAATVSSYWTSNRIATERPNNGSDHLATSLLVLLLLTQLVMGAFVRHTGAGILGHICVAVLVLILTLGAGVRAWGLNPEEPVLQRLGIGLLGMVLLQVILGVLALVVLNGAQPPEHPSILQAAVTTAHQVNGALLLSFSALLAAWTRRLLAPASAPFRSHPLPTRAEM